MGDFSKATEHRAAKKYTCDACEADIAKGETYHRSVGVWEGEFYTTRAHNDCWAAYWPMRDALDNDEFTISYVAELRAYDRDEVQKTLDAIRDGFPAVVHRLELALGIWHPTVVS